MKLLVGPIIVASLTNLTACSQGKLPASGRDEAKSAGESPQNSSDLTQGSSSKVPAAAGRDDGKPGTDPLSQAALNCIRDALFEGAKAGAVLAKIAYGKTAEDNSYETEVLTLSNGTTITAKRLLKPDPKLPGGLLSYAGFKECVVDRSQTKDFASESSCLVDELKSRGAKAWIVDYKGPILEDDFLVFSFQDETELPFKISTNSCE